jgi:hypothetical protein
MTAPRDEVWFSSRPRRFHDSSPPGRARPSRATSQPRAAPLGSPWGGPSPPAVSPGQRRPVYRRRSSRVTPIMVPTLVTTTVAWATTVNAVPDHTGNRGRFAQRRSGAKDDQTSRHIPRARAYAPLFFQNRARRNGPHFAEGGAAACKERITTLLSCGPTAGATLAAGFLASR